MFQYFKTGYKLSLCTLKETIKKYEAALGLPLCSQQRSHTSVKLKGF